jgi:hypothetical protein
MELSIRELQSGKPTVTGVPYFLSGASVGATGITFSDGSVQTTAASDGRIVISSSPQLASNFSIASNVYAYTTLASTVTPQSVDSVVILFPTITIQDGSSSAEEKCEYKIRRGNTDIGLPSGIQTNVGGGGNHLYTWAQGHAVFDKPLTTDTTVYYLYMREANNGAGSGTCSLTTTYENRMNAIEFP